MTTSPFRRDRLGRGALLLMLLSAVLLFVRPLAAQTPGPRLLSYQGVLSDAARTAVPDGTYTVTFRIYDAATGGAPLWEEKQTVRTIDGIFETLLGGTAPLALPFDKEYWLALELQGEAEMAPRMQFVAAPYAMRSYASQTSLLLDPAAPDVVHHINGRAGNLVVIGEGAASIRSNGDTLAVVVRSSLPSGARDGQYVRFNGATGAWEAVDLAVATAPRLSGNGSTGAPLDIAKMGATNGQPLVWDDATNAWKPGTAGVRTKAPITGDGSAAAPIALQNGSADAQVMTWDAAAGTWKPAEARVKGAQEISGTGTTADPLRLAQQGAPAGQVLRWDATANAWRPGPSISTIAPPLRGTGAPSDPLGLVNGVTTSSILYWDGTQWKGTTGRLPLHGEVLRWNAGTKTWEPAGMTIADNGDIGVGGSMNIGGSLTVNGPGVNLPAGSISNAELANSRIKLLYGAGIAGDDSVALGATLNVRNTGVLSLTGTANQVTVDTARGNVTIALASDLRVDTLTAKGLRTSGNAVIGGDLTVNGTAVNLPPRSIDNSELANPRIKLLYGAGIAGDDSVALGATLNVRNTGVLSLTGRTNQVIVDTARGNVTITLPQDIHRDARPQFDGLTLDALTTGSTSDTLLVSNGGVIQTRTASSLAPALAGTFWTTTGNAGTTPGTNFVGTTDDQALQLHVGNGVTSGTDGRGRVMRFEPNGSSPNIIGGYSGNSVTAGTTGNTIAGGGQNGSPNTIGSSSGVVSGGRGNTIAASANTSTIAGGLTNTIRLSATSSAIGGGQNNVIDTSSSNGVIAGGNTNAIGTSSGSSTIGGGSSNQINGSSASSTVSGGSTNRIRPSAGSSVISGGSSNTIDTSAGTSVISGGNGNRIGVSASTSVISGGASNSTLSTTTVISGGDNNTIGTNARWSSISGGHNGGIADNAYESHIGAGEGNKVGAGSVRTTIGGGSFNIVEGSSGNSTIPGGYGNTLRTNSDRSTIGGGMTNTIDTGSTISTIGGGFTNVINKNANTSTISGGSSNTVGVGATITTISGGTGNSVRLNSGRSTIGGGQNNVIDTNSTVSTISGGSSNQVGIGSGTATIGGGSSNVVGAGSTNVTIGGGASNTVGAGAGSATIAGGTNNVVSGARSAIAGGRGLTLSGTGSFGFLGANTGSNDMQISTNNVTAFGNTALWLANNNNTASQLRFYEPNATTGAFPGTANYSSFQAGAQAADINYVLPDTAGIAGDVLKVKSVAGATVTLDWAADSAGISGWLLTGNTGTTPGTNFVGTNDDQALQFHIGNGVSTGTDGRGRIMRYEPNATSANIIGGYRSNSVTGGVVGATIAGGGANGNAHSIGSNYSTIGGGNRNTIGASSINATIAGGVSNSITASAGNGTIGGGLGNTITSGDHTTIAGGFNNRINTGAFGSTVSGGTNNAISSHTTVISGGNGNIVGTSSQFSSIGGGSSNSIGNSSFETVINGGTIDTIESSAPYSTIGGGTSHAIRASSDRGTIAGGYDNEIGSSASSATISGGASNQVGASATAAVVAGGTNNVVSGARSAIAGGRGLTLSGTGSFGFLGANTGSNDMQISTNNVTAFGNTALWLANNNNTASQLRFYEPNASAGAFPGTTNYTSFQAGAQTADINYVLPDTAGIAGDVLKVKSVAGATVTLDWAADSTGLAGWALTGNTGTTPGTNFVGTNDDQALQFHIGNGVSTGTDGRGRVMRYEPNATSANIIGGYRSNSVTGGVVGATIAGGGANGNAHSISSNYGTIGGGNRNTIGASSINATIAGGVSNSITASAGNGTIGGGLGNVITSGDHTTIAGGFNNNIGTGAFGTTISGGTNNLLSSHTSVIGGGNHANIGTSSQFSVIDGGSNNTIGNSSFESKIGGGTIDTIEASAPYSTIGGGTTNAIRSSATKSTIAGGYDNEIGSSADRATIGGGELNTIGSGSYRTVIAGGYQNGINGSSNGRWSVIGGGEQNYINAISSTIAGGTHDTIESSAQNSFIGGGDLNAVRSSAQYAVITGGRSNQISSSATYAVLGGGQSNTVGGARSVIPGGQGMTLNGAGSFGFLGANTGANDMTIAAANTAVFGNTDLWLANNDNAPSQLRFYSNYNTSGAFPSTTKYVSFQAPTSLAADEEFILPATTGAVGDQLTISAIAGTQVTLGWAAPSDRRIKSDIVALDGENVLAKFRDVQLGSWRYTNDPSGRRHYGIMAQDFHRLFGRDGHGVIGTDTTVNNLDMMGVSYLAIQALEKRTSEQNDRVEKLIEAVQTLEARVRKLSGENAELRERLEQTAAGENMR